MLATDPAARMVQDQTSSNLEGKVTARNYPSRLWVGYIDLGIHDFGTSEHSRANN